MFLLRKKAIEIENGVTDGTLLTFYHGTKPRNITGFLWRASIGTMEKVVCILHIVA